MQPPAGCRAHHRCARCPGRRHGHALPHRLPGRYGLERHALRAPPACRSGPLPCWSRPCARPGPPSLYLNNDGYPPLEIGGFRGDRILSGRAHRELAVRGDISSQYISALLMVGPRLPGGLRLHAHGPRRLAPLHQHDAGADAAFRGQLFVGKRHADWFAGRPRTSPPTTLSKPIGRRPATGTRWWPWPRPAPKSPCPACASKSLQGDQAIASIMTHFGVETTFPARCRAPATASRSLPRANRNPNPLISPIAPTWRRPWPSSPPPWPRPSGPDGPSQSAHQGNRPHRGAANRAGQVRRRTCATWAKGRFRAESKDFAGEQSVRGYLPRPPHGHGLRAAGHARPASAIESHQRWSENRTRNSGRN